MISERVLTGGQPAQTALEQLCQAGCCLVVNLRPEAELGSFDEASIVEALGMRYVHIPVGRPHDLHAEAARRLHDALSADAESLILVHCASGNRVGALMALRAHAIEGKQPDEALRIGLDAGLDPEGPLYQFIRRQLG